MPLLLSAPPVARALPESSIRPRIARERAPRLSGCRCRTIARLCAGRVAASASIRVRLFCVSAGNAGESGRGRRSSARLAAVAIPSSGEPLSEALEAPLARWGVLATPCKCPLRLAFRCRIRNRPLGSTIGLVPRIARNSRIEQRPAVRNTLFWYCKMHASCCKIRKD